MGGGKPRAAGAPGAHVGVRIKVANSAKPCEKWLTLTGSNGKPKFVGKKLKSQHLLATCAIVERLGPLVGVQHVLVG